MLKPFKTIPIHNVIWKYSFKLGDYTRHYTVEQKNNNNNNENNECKRICSVNLMRAWVQLHNFVIYVVCLISSSYSSKCTIFCVCVCVRECTVYKHWVHNMDVKINQFKETKIHIYK